MTYIFVKLVASKRKQKTSEYSLNIWNMSSFKDIEDKNELSIKETRKGKAKKGRQNQWDKTGNRSNITKTAIEFNMYMACLKASKREACSSSRVH